MLINVTQDHIDRGVASDCEKCPVALAVFEAVPGCVYADVSDAGVMCHQENKETGAIRVLKIRTPYSVFSFYSAFDSGREVSPFSFEFPVIGEGA